MSTKPVAGIGLACSLGRSLEECTLFDAAGVAPRAPAMFFRPADIPGGELEPIPASPAPWLPVDLCYADRIKELAIAAMRDALGLTAGESVAAACRGIDVHLVYGDGRRASRIAQDAIRHQMGKTFPTATLKFGEGGTAAFSALAPLQRPAVVVAVDSLFNSADASDSFAHPPSWWEPTLPPLGEGAAALWYDPSMTGNTGTVSWSGVMHGTPSEEDAHPLDGIAFTKLLADCPPLRLSLVVGQDSMEPWRFHTWAMGLGRHHQRLANGWQSHSLESTAGRMGGAAGLSNLVWGMGLQRFIKDTPSGAGAAWSMDPDGRCGLVLFETRVPR